MKKISPIFFLLFSAFIFSQETTSNLKVGSISGKIIDSINKENLQYVNIISKNKKGEIITDEITNIKGEFRLKNLALDSIFLEVKHIGYKKIIIAKKLTKENYIINLNTILLVKNSTQLKEIKIISESKSVVQKIDRKVYHIDKDLGFEANNSLQILENIPSVQVNFQSGNITLRGNNKVRVLVDGKSSNLSPLKLLKQIPSYSVKSVEVITNPSAKYTPEGMSGIINIVLKKNKTIGFNGSLNIGQEHSINTRPTTSLDLNYRTGKVNIYSNYGLDLGDFETVAIFDRIDKKLSQKINYKDNTTTKYLKTGIDYYINKENTLSFYTSQSFSDTDFNTDTKVNENNSLIFNAYNLSHFKTKEQAYNLDYKLNINDSGEEVEVEINYTKTANPQNDFNKEIVNLSSKVYNYTNHILNNTNSFSANIDYAKPISGGKLELGLAVRIQNTFNNIITDQEIETIGNPAFITKGNSTFNYDRDIYSGYVNYTKEFSKTVFQGGIRLEHFNVSGLFSNTQQATTEPYADKFFTIYPSAFFTYYPSDKNEFQLSYSRRVDRPGIEQVTPIQEWTSPLSTSIGNRTLQPQFTNSFEVNFTRNIKKGHYSFGIFYRLTSDKIGRIINKDPVNNNRQLLSYANYDTANSYGIEFSSSFKITDWWSLRPNTNLYIQDSQGLINNKFESIKNTLFSARISNNFKASKRVRFYLSSYYRGKTEGVQFKVNPYLLVNASAKLTILKGKGSITLRGTDIFDNYKLDFTTTNPSPQTGRYTLEYSSIYIGFNYMFGEGKNRVRNRKYREINETEGSGGVL